MVTQELKASQAQGKTIVLKENSSAPALGKVGLGATREAAVFEEVQSARTKKQAVPTIRVDTVVIEKWHTQTGGEAEGRKGREVGDRARDRPKPFYRHCTIGFWVLLLLTFGRIAFRIMKAIYLRK